MTGAARCAILTGMTQALDFLAALLQGIVQALRRAVTQAILIVLQGTGI